MRDVRDYFNRIQARLLLAFGVVLAGTLLLAWFGLRSVGQASDEAVARIGALQENLQTASELQVTILRQVQSGEHYVLDGDSLSRARFRDLGAEARTLLARYAQLPGLTADARKNVARIAAVRQRLEGEYLAAEALREDGNLDAAAARLETAEPMVAELGTLLRGLARTQSTQIEDVTRLIQGDSDVRRLAFLIILPLAIVIALYVVLRTVATIHRPLNRLVLAANQFGDGNLNVRVSGVMPTELRVLANAFGDMADRLRNIVGETVTTAEHIRISASDLSSISEEVAASSGEVASAMVEITSGAETQAVGLRTVDEALDVIRARAAEVSGAADDLQQLGRQIRQLAEERREEIGRALRVLLEVRGVVTAAGREVEALDESSKSISSFVEAIQGIARQTHLLALNAAIEAARAGEHGRGFAVVAEEVRKLADGSARAAEEVSSSVRAIRGELRGVVETITEGVTRVAGVEEVSKGAEAAFEDIIGAVAKVHEAAERLAMAAAGNGGAVATVESTVRAVGSTAESHAASAQQVSAAAEEQSAATEHMSAASMELLHSAERLKDLVRGFRV